MPLNPCLDQIGKTLKGEMKDYFDDLSDRLLQRKNEIIKSGVSETEADKQLLTEHHKELFDELNELKGALGEKQDDYQQPTFTTKSERDAISEQSTSGVLQHPQEGIGETGGGRGRVEPSEQGAEPPEESKTEKSTPAQEEGAGQRIELPENSIELFGNITRITHAVVDAERERAGLPEITKGLPKKDAGTLQKALNKVGSGYTLEDMLSEFKTKKEHTDDDTMNLLLFKKDRQDQLRHWNDALNDAFDKQDKSAYSEAMVKKSRILDDFDKIGQLAKKFGTEAGLTLRAQRFGLGEDYSLDAMISRKRAANGGRALTDAERLDIENKFNAIQKRVGDLEKQVEALKAKQSSKSIKLKGKELADKIRGLRPKTDSAQANILGLPIAIYDTAIVTVANAVEKGAELVDAITEGVKYLKSKGYALKDEEQRDFRKHIYDQAGESVEFKNILTPEAIKARAELAREQNSFDAEIEKDEKRNASRLEKGLNMFVDWERAGKLMWPTTIAKLTSAAMTRLIQSPVEDVIGKGVDIAFPSLAEKATGESGFNVKAQAKLFTQTFTKGMKDAADIMKKGSFGKSDIDFAFGGKRTVLPPEAVQFFGQLHSMLKAPIKRGIFERSLEKRIANNIKIGNDVGDPNVQMRIATQAFKDANRAIFMQDNLVSKAYQSAITAMERHGPGGKLSAAAMKYMIPFVRVPTNIVGETVTLSPAGLVMGGAKFMHVMFTKGLEGMTEDEADMIHRMIKKGLLGSAVMTYAYLNPENFGGIYQPGKKDQGEIKYGQMKFLGITFPSWLLHAPIFNVAQLGATIRRVHDKYAAKHDSGALSNGVWAGAIGLAEEEPLVKQPLDFGKLAVPKERRRYFGELAKNTVSPGLLQFAAKVERGYNPWTERTSNAPNPQTLVEHVKTGFPLLTESVPSKGGAKK